MTVGYKDVFERVFLQVKDSGRNRFRMNSNCIMQNKWFSRNRGMFLGKTEVPFPVSERQRYRIYFSSSNYKIPSLAGFFFFYLPRNNRSFSVRKKYESLTNRRIRSSAVSFYFHRKAVYFRSEEI